MSKASNLDRRRTVLAIGLPVAIGIVTSGVLLGLLGLTIYVPRISDYFIVWVAIPLLVVFVGIAVALNRRLAPFLGAYTHDDLRPLLEARVSTEGGGMSPLKNWIGDKKTILYFYSEDDPDRTNKARAFQDRMEAYKEAGIKVYGVAVPPVTTESSDVPQQEHNQQFQVLVDKNQEAVNALRRMNTQVKDPQLALLIAPEAGLSKMYSEASSSTQANKILEDAKVLSKGEGNMDGQSNGEKPQGVDQTASSATTSTTQGGQSTTTTPANQTSAPYGFFVALAAVTLVSLVSVAALLIFKDVFQNATDVTTLLGSLFAVVGTVVGAYFGIKASSDATDKVQGAIETANNTANRALAKMPPEAAEEVLGSGIEKPAP